MFIGLWKNSFLFHTTWWRGGGHCGVAAGIIWSVVRCPIWIDRGVNDAIANLARGIRGVDVECLAFFARSRQVFAFGNARLDVVITRRAAEGQAWALHIWVFRPLRSNEFTIILPTIAGKIFRNSVITIISHDTTNFKPSGVERVTSRETVVAIQFSQKSFVDANE